MRGEQRKKEEKWEREKQQGSWRWELDRLMRWKDRKEEEGRGKEIEAETGG